MKLLFSAIGLASVLGSTVAGAKLKTTSPVPVNPARINDYPYRVNGLVLTETARGSGFCAGHPRTFFTAAHVVYGDQAWAPPPAWISRANSLTLNPDKVIFSRGYYRFDSYAKLVKTRGESRAFGRDVALAFAFENVIRGKPAQLSYTGSPDLRSNKRKLITGYPAVKDYTGDDTSGFFLHKTGPFRHVYKPASNGSVQTTLVATGPGNSGGPVWTMNKPKGRWKVSGILVGGLPSESEVYYISRDTRVLQNAVKPVISKNPAIPTPTAGVSASSLFFPYTRSHTLPDGASKWSRYSVGVFGFGEFSSLTSARISLQIKTAHRGDLQVMLVAPGGYAQVIHNEEGANKKNLIIVDRDVTEAFTGINPKGRWTLRVRDRLKGDISVFKGFRLEISADKVEKGGTEPTP